ncbi:hypothetical protein D3C74_286510 [compost metagenome]
MLFSLIDKKQACTAVCQRILDTVLRRLWIDWYIDISGLHYPEYPDNHIHITFQQQRYHHFAFACFALGFSSKQSIGNDVCLRI